MSDNKWKRSHRIIMFRDGWREDVDVMLVEGAAYTEDEWDATDNADYERQDDGRWTFQGKPFRGRVVELWRRKE